MNEYALVADQFDQIVSEPGAPLQYKRRLRGDLVPLTDAEEIARLLRAGAIAPAEAVKAAAGETDSGAHGAGTPPGPREPDTAPTLQGDATARPSNAGTTAAWVEYAVARGADRAEVADWPRADLIKAYG